MGWALEIETFLGPVKWHRALLNPIRAPILENAGLGWGGGGASPRKECL